MRLSLWPARIRGKIVFILAICFLFMVVVVALNSWNLKKIELRLLSMESVEDFSNMVLEIRRFEKNYILYADEESFRETRNYIRSAQQITDRLLEEGLVTKEMHRAISEALKRYQESLAEIHETQIEGLDRQRLENALRDQGRILLDMAQSVLKGERDRIAKTLQMARFVPYFFLMLLLLLITFLANLLARKIITPLRYIERTTEKIARGDFTTIPPIKKTKDEIYTLITAFNSMIREIESRQEQLLQSRKMAAIGTLTSGIAHELNNPLNNIALTADLILEQFDDLSDLEKKKLVEDVTVQVQRASEIVKNLLDFTRTEKPVLTTFALQDVIRSTLNLVRNELQMGDVTVEVDVPESIPLIRGDPRKIRQVLLNLVINAIQAMPNGGTLTLAAEPDGSDFVRLMVKDTGVGIPEENLGAIFDPFFTTKETGTGLGLAVSYGIMKEQGGMITVESKLGQGTVFSLHLRQAGAAGESAEDNKAR